jgi:hypothetical protein
MKKLSLFLLIALAFASLASWTSAQASPSLDPEVQRVGYVVAYTAGESITIVDRDGVQFTFALASNLKIVPVHRADLLKPGAYVTIIAPNNVAGGKLIAAGIVIHPQAPSSFPSPTFTFTPLPTDTALPTATELPSETPTEVPTETVVVTETPTETPTGVFTETVTATETATETPTEMATETATETATDTPTSTVEVPTDTPTPTETPAVTVSSQTDTQSMVTSFMDWLASLFHQFVSSGR